MKIIEIEGIKVPYKDVSDLNHKVKGVLSKIQRKRERLQAEFSVYRKKEKGLKKFLGVKEDKESSITQQD